MTGWMRQEYMMNPAVGSGNRTQLTSTLPRLPMNTHTVTYHLPQLESATAAWKETMTPWVLDGSLLNHWYSVNNNPFVKCGHLDPG